MTPDFVDSLILPPFQFGDARFQFCDSFALFFQLRLHDCKAFFYSVGDNVFIYDFL